MHPTPAEEKELFQPQQSLRAVDNAIESKLASYLYDDANGSLIQALSLQDLLSRIGIGIEKLGPGRFHEKQAGAALRKFGWSEKRSSKPPRPRLWFRPDAASQQGGAPFIAEEDDNCPF